MSDSFDLLLAGAGHAHLGVLRLWRERRARPSARIALVNDGPCAWYSGALPGLLAGRYRLEQCGVALQPLCQRAGIRLIEDRLVGLEPAARRITLASGRSLSATWLSLDLGSRPRGPDCNGAGLGLLAVKPFAAFIEGWRSWQREPEPLAVIGGGAAGVELALAAASQVGGVALLSAGPLLAGHPAALRKRALRHLARAGVEVRENTLIDRLQDDVLFSENRVVWRGRRAILAPAPHRWAG